MANIINPIIGSTEIVEIVTAGPRGPQGTPGTPGTSGSVGPSGSQGPSGSEGAFPTSGSYLFTGSLSISGSLIFEGNVFITGSFTGSYLHIQGSPLSTWTVTHNLQNEYPAVIVYDLDKKQMLPQDITSLSTSSMAITFPQPTSGYAYFSVGTNLAIPNFGNIPTSSSILNAQTIIFGF